MIPLTLDALQAFLSRQGISSERQVETDQLFFVLIQEKKECPVFIRVFPDGRLLQWMLFFPMKVEPKTRADTARLLHYFNKELDIPGFGMDEDAGVCFFRCVIPCAEKEISEEILLGYLNTCKTVCEQFFASIGVITTGTITFPQLLERAQKQHARDEKKHV